MQRGKRSELSLQNAGNQPRSQRLYAARLRLHVIDPGANLMLLLMMLLVLLMMLPIGPDIRSKSQESYCSGGGFREVAPQACERDAKQLGAASRCSVSVQRLGAARGTATSSPRTWPGCATGVVCYPASCAAGSAQRGQERSPKSRLASPNCAANLSGPVLGCIETDYYNQTFMLQDFSRSSAPLGAQVCRAFFQTRSNFRFCVRNVPNA